MPFYVYSVGAGVRWFDVKIHKNNFFKKAKMRKNNIRDTPVIVIPKGYTIDDLMDFDDEGYENGEPVRCEEVKAVFEQ